MITKTNNSNIAGIGLLWMILLISSVLNAEQLEQPFKVEVDYQIVTKSSSQDIAQLSELEAISNIEIFYWYGCESCYQVEAAVMDYLRLNPEITTRRTPLILRTPWRQQAYIQPLMMQFVNLQNLPDILQIYQQCLSDCNRFKDFNSILDWFSEKMPAQELPSVDRAIIWQTEKNFRKRADLFSIRQVPTIIINERYKVDANQAQTARRLVEIIDFLISK